MKENNLDIIIPCYNPLKDWHKTMLNSYNLLAKSLLNTNITIILVNDGSTFGISEHDINFLEKQIPNFTYLGLSENMGKGFAIREGFKISQAEYSIFTDIDFPYEERNLIEMYDKLKNYTDIVIGIRDEEYYDKVPAFRKFISKSFKKVLKVVFQIPTSDTQAGLKAFSKKGREVILKTTTNRYLFDLEMIKLAAKDKSMQFEYTKLNLKDNIILSKLSMKLLVNEFKNLIKILFL